MELPEFDNKLKSAYDIASTRNLGGDENSNQDASRPKRFESEYDEDLFIPCEEFNPPISKMIEERPEPLGIDPQEIDQVTSIEKVEALTHPEIPETEAYSEMADPRLEEFEVKTHYRGPIFDYGGYARMNRTFIFGLRNHGALVKVDPFDSIMNVNGRTEAALRSLAITNVPDVYPKIFGMTIPDLIVHPGKKILFTMMETSKKVHQEYADRLSMADEIWTPCSWCKEVFEDSGVSAPIKLMPLGVDTDRYRPGLEPIDFGDSVRSFKFMSISGWSYRKGFDILIRAYMEEFSPKDDTTLIISSRFSGNLSQKSKNRLLSDFQAFRSMVKKPDSELPHIVLHSTYTPENKMPNFFAAADCFALISRGEGWGLPYCEAGACEIPVIASDHGGQKDFLDEETAYMIPPNDYFVSKTQDPQYKNMAWISHFYENQLFPDFEGESFELLKSKMRSVYENYPEAKRRAVKLRERLVEKFDWKHSVSRAYNRLSEICKEI
jgi:glycosyltransferase involved in cell wall biosynthesis